jgi:hypothetical protein
MSGSREIIKDRSSNTCLKGDSTVNVQQSFGTDGAVKTHVVCSCPLSLPKCELELYGTCSLRLNKDEG